MGNRDPKQLDPVISRSVIPIPAGKGRMIFKRKIPEVPLDLIVRRLLAQGKIPADALPILVTETQPKNPD